VPGRGDGHALPGNSPTDLRQALQMATAGEYEIHHELGRGGMGSVFLAREIGLDRLVAIKVLPPTLMFDEGLITRFKREARMVAKLHHPNIIPVYRVHHTQNLAFYTMHFVPGRSVSEIMSSKRVLSLAEVERIMREASAGLGYAHKRGVIHRDVKPANILVDAEGHVHLTDFGIAKALMGNTQLTETGAVIGTPQYMAPEQCEAKMVDGRADQYSLAVVGYQLLTGRPPFESDSMKELLYHHLFTPPRPLNAVRADVPLPLRDAIHKALSKDPSERFDSMEDFARAIEGKGPPIFVSWLEGPVERRRTPAPGSPQSPQPTSGDGGTTEKFLEAPWAAGLDLGEAVPRLSSYRRAMGALAITVLTTAAVAALALSRDDGVAGQPGEDTPVATQQGASPLSLLGNRRAGDPTASDELDGGSRTAAAAGDAESTEKTTAVGVLTLSGELPSNVQLRIDEQPIPWPPAEGSSISLTRGTHKLDVAAAGYRPFNQEIYIEPDTERVIRVELEKVPAEPAQPRLVRNATPSAEVLGEIDATLRQGEVMLTTVGRPADALTLYEQAHEQARSSLDTYGGSAELKWYLLRSLMGQGAALHELGRYVDAATTYRKVRSFVGLYQGTGLDDARLIDLSTDAQLKIADARTACEQEGRARCPRE